MTNLPTALPPRRLYERIADAVSLVLIVVTVGGAAVGLTRWQDAHTFRKAVEARVGAEADRLAAAVAAGGAEAAKSVPGLERASSVHVVTSGGTDEFGIAVGSAVAYERIFDPLAQPADAKVFAQDLLNRSAELDDYHAKKQPVPADRRYAAADFDDEYAGVALFAAVAPVVKGGAYVGLVRVAERVERPAPSVPTSRALLGLALALALGFAVSFVKKPATLMEGVKVPKKPLREWRPHVTLERLAFAGAAAVVLVVVMAGQSFGLVFWTALVAAVFALMAGPGFASVARGVRERPGTYLYVFPAMIGMIVLVFIPFGMGVALAFFSDGEFTGLANFKEILFPPATAHTTFYTTTGFTVLWTVTNVLLHVGIGLSLALVLNREKLAFKGLYRVLLIVPWAVPNYITALIWKSMFNPQFGAVNGFLDALGIEPVNWLGPGSSFASNYIAALTTNTWLGFPFMMVVTLGALQSIPKDLYEAADIDGATRLQKFRTVTLPLLKPALIPAIILGVIWTFNMFNVIYLVSGGAPENETNILVTEAYYAFKVLNRFGLAAAYSLLIFVMLLLYGWMQNRITRATEGAFE